MKTKVVHCKKEKYDVFIGRPSKWGNPFSLFQYSREECIQLYEEYIRNKPELLNCLHELEGKILGCFCKPLACHGDVLVKLIEEK